MYYYEKDYIMRMIHGTAQVLARIFLGRQMEEEGEVIFLWDQAARDQDGSLRRMIDAGQVNEAEEKLFGLLETAVWSDREKASLALSFYDYLNSKKDEFLAAAGFSREEIITGLEDALKAANMEIPEYLRL